MKTYDLKFKGYWRDVNRQGLPMTAGIYIVYKCTYNELSDTVTLLEILYIGQAKNLNERVDTHDKREVFISKCDGAETLCYSVAEVKETDLNIVENALVFAQKPALNDKLKDRFSYESAEFHIEGRCALLEHLNFTIG